MTSPAPSRLHRTTSSGAFTLLELVLVMAILCIVMAMVTLSLRDFGRGRVGGDCAAEVTALAGWARAQAIARGVTYRLNLDPAAGKFWLTVEGPDGTTFEPLGEEFGRVFTAPDGVTLDWADRRQADAPYVDFRPTGRTDPATIRVVDPAGVVTEIASLSATEPFQIQPAAATSGPRPGTR